MKAGITRNSVLAKSARAAYRLVDGEAVVVELKGGVVNVLNTTGSRIWELLDGKRTAAGIAAEMAETYAVDSGQALEDTLDFLEDMTTKQLVVPAGGNTVAHEGKRVPADRPQDT